ncbi:hypothetical protein N9W89_10000 [Hellea sp.]|nr:hypothetical protein [Hellea sp.]
MTNVQKQVTDMNAGWYNVVSNALNIDQSTFRLAQGTLGLQSSDNSGVYLMSDSEPSGSAVQYYDAGGMSRRSENYNMLLHAISPETGANIQSILGNDYANWMNYYNAYMKANPLTPDTYEQILIKFAGARLAPNQATKVIALIKKAQTSPLSMAIDQYNDKSNKMQFFDSAGQPYSLRKYSIDIQNVTAALNRSSINGKGGVTIDFDSSTMDTSLSSSSATGSASGFFDIFSGGAGGNFTKTNQTAASSKFTVKGTIGQNATISTQPVGWFDSSEFNRAYSGKTDAAIWDPQANAGDWDSFFDKNTGSLARHVSQLIFVSDYDITVTSHASYSTSDFTQIQANATFGVWPFFSATANTTHTTSFTHNQDGSLSTRHVLPKNVPQIWGVNVLEAPN